MKRTALIALIALAGFGCKGNIELGTPSGDPTTPAPGEPALLDNQRDPAPDPDPSTTTTPTTTPEQEEPTTTVEIPEFTGAQIESYMRSIAQMLVSRPVNQQEASQLREGGVDAIEPILRTWTSEPAFAENARYMMQQLLKASGERDGINFELPGYLVRHVVSNDLPWSEILTADYCVNAAGEQIECDTGAPYAAGVLGTRAYLAGNASRFNLGRANRMMATFACRVYPMESDLQPYLDKQQLIPMFQANSAEEQTVEEAEGGFGNGAGCYTCHGQFGAHAQLFVKYDEAGMYVADADGQQDPDGELGRSVNGLMTSHMIEPQAAASESAQIFGRTVANLGEAAEVIADSDPFLACQAKNIIVHTLGLSESTDFERSMLESIATRARQLHAEPTFADLAVTTFTEPRVILAVVGTSNEGGTQ